MTDFVSFRRLGRRIVFLVSLVLGPGLLTHAAPGDLRGHISTEFISPVDITLDESDGTYWVTSFIDPVVYHRSADLTETLGTIPVPWTNPLFSLAYGIAYNAASDTLFLVETTFTKSIIEINKEDGSPTARKFTIPFQGEGDRPFGLALDPGGDGGAGSLYLVEGDDRQIYELALDGGLIRAFPDASDADSIFREAQPFDIELVFEDGQLAGFLVLTRGLGILRLDRDGHFTGEFAPTDLAGSKVDGLALQPFADPETGQELDTYLAVVAQGARISLLEAGTRAFAELTHVSSRQNDREAELSWKHWSELDAIEILDHCEVIEVLPGSATSWSGTLDDGIHELSARATLAGQSWETASQTFVMGTGQALQGADLAAFSPGGLAFNGSDTLLVAENTSDPETPGQKRLLLFSLDLEPAGSVPVSLFFAAEGDTLGGLAFQPATNLAHVYNRTQHTLGRIEVSSGAFLVAVPVNLPFDAPRRERPSIGGMTFRAAGDDGRGSLLMNDLQNDVIIELDLTGEPIRQIPHPYVELNATPEGSTYGVLSVGLAMASGGGPEALYLTGGLWREGFQRRIFRMDLETGEIIGRADVTTLALSSFGSYFIEHVHDGERPRLYALGTGDQLTELDLGPPAVGLPTFLTATQTTLEDDVNLQFTNNGPYDRVEIFRDCEKIDEISGDAASYLDLDAPTGLRDYALRGVSGGLTSDFARSSLRVGVGAVLADRFTWPVEQPQHLTRDPGDGTLYVLGKIYSAVDEALSETQVHLFNPALEYVSTHPVSPPDDVLGFAIRRTPGGDGVLTYLHETFDSFRLRQENLGGFVLGDVEVVPPLPPQPFVIGPTGLAWLAASDSFIYYGRNTQKFVEISASDGAILEVFDHPLPSPDRSRQSPGVWHSAERNTLFTAALSQPSDIRTTQIIEMTRDGRPTGLSVPLPGGFGARGLVFDEERLAVIETSSGRIIELKVFPDPRGPGAKFLRGDANGDGGVNTADPSYILNFLFLGGPAPECRDSADPNDDGGVNIADPSYLFQFIFLGGAAPPYPFPEPGTDPTPDASFCEE